VAVGSARTLVSRRKAKRAENSWSEGARNFDKAGSRRRRTVQARTISTARDNADSPAHVITSLSVWPTRRRGFRG
jgi:hypothetical protein